MSVREQFPPTPWTLLRSAVDSNHKAERAVALDYLCRHYWYPLYAFARLKKLTHEDAQDQTQIFLARMIERNTLEQADPARGKFRSYLLSSFQNQLINQWGHDNAKRRGGGVEVVSFDMLGAKERFESETSSCSDPVAGFDRAWAMALLDACLEEMAAMYQSNGEGEEFALLRPFLSPLAVSHADPAAVATSLGLSEVAIRQRISRLRARFSKLLRRHVADSLADPTPGAVEDEMRFLRDTLERL